MGKATRLAKRAKYHAAREAAMKCARAYPVGHPGREQWVRIARIMNRRMIVRLRAA